MFTQHSTTKPHVLPERLQQAAPAYLVAMLLNPRPVAEATLAIQPCPLRRHPTTHILLRLHVQVKPHLFIYFAVQSVRRPQRTKTTEKSLPSCHPIPPASRRLKY